MCKKKILNLSIIEFIFIILAFLTIITLLLSGKITVIPDNIFHWQRISELADSLKHLNFPQFNHYVAYYGGATFTFYPWLNVIPLALLKLLGATPFEIFYGYAIVVMIMGENIAYFSCKTVDKSKWLAFLFSIFYCISTITVFQVYPAADYGEFLAVMLVPLVFFGWINWLRHNHFYMMTIGLVLIAYCHIVTLLLSILLLVILTITEHNIINKNRLKNILKTFLYFITSTTLVWLPIIILGLNNYIKRPIQVKLSDNAFLIPHNLNQFGFEFLVYWSLVDLVGIVLGIIYWKQLSSLIHHFYEVGLGFLAVTFNWWPWFLIQKTPIAWLQFPKRFCDFSHLLLTFVCVYIIVKVINKKFYAIKGFTLFLLLFATLSISNFREWQGVEYGKTYHYTNTQMFRKKHLKLMQEYVSVDAVCLKNNNFIHNERMLSAPIHFDYVTRGLEKHFYYQHIHFHLSHRKYKKIHSSRYAYKKYKKAIKYMRYKEVNSIIHGNKMILYNQNRNDINLPINIYRPQIYHLYVNNHPARWINNDGIVKLINPPKGRVEINYIAPVMWYRWLAIIVSVISSLVLIFKSCSKKIKEKLNANPRHIE